MAGGAGALGADQARRLLAVQQGLQSGRASQMLPLARGLAAEVPSAPDAHHLLALCLAEAGELDAAEQAMQRALELAPRNPMLQANMARLLRRRGRPAEALAHWRAAAEAGDAGAWRQLGLAALDAGDRSVAVDALRHATSVLPTDPVAWHALANALRDSGELAATRDALERVVQLTPSDPTAWINLGIVHRLEGRPDIALEHYGRAEHLGYQGAQLLQAVAGALADQGQPSAALVAARRLVREHPGLPEAHSTLAQLLWEYGDPAAPDADALAPARTAAQAQPGNRPLQRTFAELLLQSRRFDEALGVVRTLRAGGDHLGLATLEADLLERMGDGRAAGALYDRLHAQWQSAGSAPAGFLCAYTRHLLKAGRWADARDRALEATRVDDTDQEAWAYLATAWRLLGDAREDWLCDWDRLVARLQVPLPPAGPGEAPFLARLEAALLPLHQAQREPMQQSVRGGSQTSGRLFGRPDPVIQAAASALKHTVHEWLAGLPDDDKHPFLSRRRRSLSYSGSWSVRLWSSGRHVSHIHSQGWLSSAFYVSLPPAVQATTDRAGWLQLGQPLEDLGLDLGPRRVVRPEPGWLALFPSYCWHGTLPFEDTAARLTMAFDMLPAA